MKYLQYCPFHTEKPSVISKKVQGEIPRSLSQLLTNPRPKLSTSVQGSWATTPVNHEGWLPCHQHVPTLQAGRWETCRKHHLVPGFVRWRLLTPENSLPLWFTFHLTSLRASAAWKGLQKELSSGTVCLREGAWTPPRLLVSLASAEFHHQSVLELAAHSSNLGHAGGARSPMHSL